MKFNFFQQFGVVLVVIGLVLLGIYSQPTRPTFDIGQGAVTFRDIPEWLPGGALFAGFGLLIVGTVWGLIRRRTKDEDEVEDEEEKAE